MKITIGKTAEGKNISFDLDTLLVTRLLIQANSGAGKSWLLRKLMEELFGHVQVIAIDPEGEFATLREKFDYVLVGKGGETPVHISTAEQVAHKLLELRASAVCDLYETPPKERHAWVRKFLESLIDAPKKLWHPAIIIVDEAQMFCPEKGESEAADAMVGLTTRGRKRGFCAVWATQRLANVNKDATSMLLNRLVGGTFEDVDLKRALDLLSVPTEEKRAVAEELKTFDAGWFYAFGRAITKTRLLFKVGPVQTSHPKPGSSKHAAEPPPPSEKIRGLLPQLADLPKVAEEKARTVQDFKARIRELTTELGAAKKALTTQTKTQIATAVNEVHPKAIALAVRKRDDEWKRAVMKWARDEEKFIIEATKVHSSNLVVNRPVFAAPPEMTDVKIAKERAEVPAAKPVASPRAASFHAAENNGDLSGPQRRIISALAQFHAIGKPAVNKKWVAALAGVSHSSGSFGNNLGALRTGGYIDYPQAGLVSLTDEGLKIAPQEDPPASAEEMLERCKRIASGPQARILDALFAHWPNSVDKATLADAVEVSATSGSFGNNLGALRSAGMIDYPAQGQVKLEPWVMLEEG